ncbi:hypothetical protein VINE108274_19190 [Vibrio neptunius]
MVAQCVHNLAACEITEEVGGDYLQGVYLRVSKRLF